jgi:hypothetical protein
MTIEHPLLIVAIVAALGALWASGTTALSRTSRATAYVILADVIEGKHWSKPAWARGLCLMVTILLIHALGLAAFASLCVYLVWQFAR